jgi:hypothetical protein
LKRIGLVAATALVAAMAACSSLRRAPHQAAPESPPPVTAENPAPSAESSEPNPPESGNENPPPSGSEAVIPTCVPPETKSKPKAKPKPRPVRKEAPPQPPSAPVVAETGPDGIVDAQVRSMPVSVVSILGKRVQSPKGEDLGRVVDVLADASGRVRIAIVDFGGFLGVGDRRIAVEWPLLRFNPDQRDPPSLLLSVSREKLKAAPEYKDNPRPQTLMVPPPPASPPAAAGSTPNDNKK